MLCFTASIAFLKARTTQEVFLTGFMTNENDELFKLAVKKLSNLTIEK